MGPEPQTLNLMPDPQLSTPTELHPQLLYRIAGESARFATWGLTDGHEALALFTTTDAADKYRADLADTIVWTIFQPDRDKLVEILQSCRAAGILYAALDPIGG